jgi:serine/threonine-protein kinase
MTCPTDEALAQMASGALHGAELEALEHHLDGCGSCRTLLAAVTHGSAPYSPPERALLKSGERLGRYEIQALLAAGGMGMLYAARDTQLNRRVVLKLMRPAFGGDIGRVRLLREAQAMASLSHPNVVAVYELGESGERVFVAMELVEGGTLRDWMKAPGTWKDVLAMMAQAAEGLAAAHRAGVVHRDFKPENVLVGTDGRPRVGDFGLARPELVAEEEPPKNLPMKVTHTGTMLGTPAYMSPEQLAGKPADARSDQYSFCVTLYEALTGKRPFPSESLEQLRAHVAGGMPPPPKDGPVPTHVWAALAKGLQPRPELRFPDMESLLAVLGAASAPVAAQPRMKRVLRTITAATLTLALGGAIATWAPRQLARVAAVARAPAAAPAPAAPAELPDLPAKVELNPDERRAWKEPGITRVVASEPSIVAINVDAASISLTGLREGSTTLDVWTGSERRAVDVHVGPEQLVLEQGMQKLIDTPGIQRVAVGDMSIADVKTIGNNQILIIGAGPGSTTLLVWTNDNRRRSYTVKVTPSQTAPAAPVAAQDGLIRLEPQMQMVLDWPGIQRIAVGDSSIVDVKTIGNDQVLLTGGDPGNTTVLVWKSGGKRSSYVVAVRRGAGSAELAMQDGAITLAPETMRELTIPGVQRIAVGDSSIVKAKTIRGDRVQIFGDKPGQTTLLAWTSDGKRTTYFISVRPTVPAPMPPILLKVGDEHSEPAPVPGGAKTCQSIDTSVATVTCAGVNLSVRALKAGKTQIKLLDADGKTQLIDVRVREAVE